MKISLKNMVGNFPLRRAWCELIGLIVLVAATIGVACAFLALTQDNASAAGAPAYGPDGYFSTMADGALPIIENETGTAGTASATGWANTRRIMFGKQDGTTYQSRQLSGGYKTLAKGFVESESNLNAAPNWGVTAASSTSSVKDGEALLWADNTVTGGFGMGSSNAFDDESNSYKSNLASISNLVSSSNYSNFEQNLMRLDKVEGVCGIYTGCPNGSTESLDPPHGLSSYDYRVFPLSSGDIAKYLQHTNGDNEDANLACPSTVCSFTNYYWLRSPLRQYGSPGFLVRANGRISNIDSVNEYQGLRPALRLKLDNLLLAAHSENQTQELADSDSLKLTFVESGKTLASPKVYGKSVTHGSSVVLKGSSVTVSGDSTGLTGDADGYGWKIVDPTDSSGAVLASGFDVDGKNIELPAEVTDEVNTDTKFELYFWAQHNGTATAGLTNSATKPVKLTFRTITDLGADGYFSELDNGALPIIDNETGTASTTSATGWANTRRILFGKKGKIGTYGDATVSGGYKAIAKGEVASESGRSFESAVVPTHNWATSSTTSVAANESLLLAESVDTYKFPYDTTSVYTNTFDSVIDSYKSNLAQVSDAVGLINYSSFEQSLFRSAQIEGVCTAAQVSGCGSDVEPTDTKFSPSVNEYKVFPLSGGDMNKFFNHNQVFTRDANLAVRVGGGTNNGNDSSWLRSARWDIKDVAHTLSWQGRPYFGNTDGSTPPYNGLRPAFRMSLDRLVLSANAINQSQSATGDLRLTFVDDTLDAPSPTIHITGAENSRTLSISGSSVLGSEFGWKVIDPDSGTVLGSGRTSAGGNMALPEKLMNSDTKDYHLYVWGQQDGTDEDGQTNKATLPYIKTDQKGWKRGGDITYHLGDSAATNHASNPSIYTYVETPVTLLNPSFTGHNFDGWYTDENLTEGPVTTIPAASEGDKEYWAKWSDVTGYEVSYNLNGGTGGTVPSSVQVDFDDPVTLATMPEGLVLSGYTFAGWNTAADGSGMSYEANSSQTFTANTTLFARWVVEREAVAGESFEYRVRVADASASVVVPTNGRSSDATTFGQLYAWYVEVSDDRVDWSPVDCVYISQSGGDASCNADASVSDSFVGSSADSTSSGPIIGTLSVGDHWVRVIPVVVSDGWLRAFGTFGSAAHSQAGSIMEVGDIPFQGLDGTSNAATTAGDVVGYAMLRGASKLQRVGRVFDATDAAWAGVSMVGDGFATDMFRDTESLRAFGSDDSLSLTNLTTTGSGFLHSSFEGARLLAALPERSFDISTIQSVGTDFMSHTFRIDPTTGGRGALSYDEVVRVVETWHLNQSELDRVGVFARTFASQGTGEKRLMAYHITQLALQPGGIDTDMRDTFTDTLMCTNSPYYTQYGLLECGPPTALPFTGSLALWWWILAIAFLTFSIPLGLSRSQAFNSYTLGRGAERRGTTRRATSRATTGRVARRRAVKRTSMSPHRAPNTQPNRWLHS
ncbi:MAG: InlB B-repeat-containing protein [Bifidobacterium sp.]|nr:InlB B-repeat-containing protein [Bifidobacterium sp.]